MNDAEGSRCSPQDQDTNHNHAPHGEQEADLEDLLESLGLVDNNTGNTSTKNTGCHIDDGEHTSIVLQRARRVSFEKKNQRDGGVCG